MTNAELSESEIFHAALRLPVEQRAGYLDQVCGGRRNLRAELESLLAAHHREGSFMEGPAAAFTVDQAVPESPGTTIGPYKLLQQIGEGGMGVVFMAEQEQPVRRRVALKIIKPGMDSRQVIARFEAERQALAMMDHQNIARVLDAGTTDSGRPYFVMELVHGVPLTNFCDDNRLTLRQRLELFLPVCQAIQHAHQKGVIHRDIKPANILVTMYDDKPVPKVIDFGVAKAVEQRLTEKTLFTQYGMLVGTFEYMSPEQAEMNAFGVDTRSDIYSLGVLLYELLTGTTPIERSKLREAALMELVRLICEEEPQRPSIRLSTSNGLPKFAAACRTEPGQLSRLVRGELDWIVMKCLEKDRARRYETANGLARDVQRYLNDEPIEACPPSAFYRVRKLVRRHRRLMSSAVAFAVLLMMVAVASSTFAMRAWRAEKRSQVALASERAARQEAVHAKERADNAVQRLRKATQVTNEGVEYLRRRNWSSAHERFTTAIESEPELDAPYIQRGALYVTLGLWDRAAQDYARRFRLARHADAQACYEHALLQLHSGNRRGYEQACEQIVEQHGSSAGIADQHAVLRSCLLAPESFGDADELARQAEALSDAAQAPWLVGLAGRAQLKAGDAKRAELLLSEAIRLGTGSPSGIHRVHYSNLATAMFLQGKRHEAREALNQAIEARDEWLSSNSPIYAGFLPELSTFSWWDWLEFDLFFHEAKSLIEGSASPEDDRISQLYQRGMAAITYGDVFTSMDTGRQFIKHRQWDAAAGEFAKVLGQLPAGFRANSQEMRFCIEMVDDPNVLSRLVDLRPDDYRPMWARGRYCASRRLWREACEAYEKSLALLSDDLTDDPGPLRGRAEMMLELATMRILLGDEVGYAELCARIIRFDSETEDAVASSLFSRALTLMINAQIDATVPLQLAEQAVSQQRFAWHYHALGLAQYRAGRADGAMRSLNKSLEIGPAWYGRAQPYLVLACLYHQMGRTQEASAWLGKARSAQRELDRSIAGSEFGYANSNFMCDWLCSLVLFAEVDSLILDTENTP